MRNVQAVCGRAVLTACQHPSRERGGDGRCQWEPAGTKPCGKLKMQAELGSAWSVLPKRCLNWQDGWFRSVFNQADGRASRERGQRYVGRGAEMNQGSAEAFICSLF